MRRVAILLPVLLALGCVETLDGDDGSGAGAATGGAGGGDAACASKACGEACGTCEVEPCNTVCDAVGACRSAYDVTCSVCPDGADRPYTGDSCSVPEGVVCEYRYGNAWFDFADCREKGFCGVNGWEYIPEASCQNFDPAYATCPMVAPNHGSPCDTAEYTSLCEYGSGNYCACTSCLSGECGGSAYWGCVSPYEGCPSDAPLLGHACSQEGQVCEYGACWLEITYAEGADLLSTRRVCQGGIWVEEDLGCPTQ